MHIEILDSTLRDGAQGDGISFSPEDQIAITQNLDELGIEYIEIGSPAFNIKNSEYFRHIKNIRLKHASLVAFGVTRRKYADAQDDPSLNALLSSGAQIASIFGKCSMLHVTEILKTTAGQNLAMIYDSVKYLCDNGMRVFFDAEHFFDGYKDNPGFAMSALKAARDGGAECLVLCDTNGGSFPQEIYDITKAVVGAFPDMKIGIHCHNDMDLSIANTIMAIRAGAAHVQGTFLGFGERCGNTSLCSLIPTLQLKMGYECIPADNLINLVATAHSISEISNIRIKANTPYIGKSAFSHKAGTHADGVAKNPASFEHIDPELIGNERRFPMSEQAGRNAVIHAVNKIAPDISKDSPDIVKILDEVKRLEALGYQFDGAAGSFELLVRKQLGMYKPFFELVSYRILDELPSATPHSATAVIKIKVGGKLQITASEGDGPVNALDLALREALGIFYPALSNVRLIDYKVRVMDSGSATAAKVRVLITSTDGKRIWNTVGADTDVFKASWSALVDSIEYKLIKG